MYKQIENTHKQKGLQNINCYEHLLILEVMMRTEVMKTFLSEENLSAHLEFMREERLRYSVYEKSFPFLKGKTLREILNLKISESIKNEFLPYIISYKSHELYFNSFCERQASCKELKRFYTSEAALLYELSERAMNVNYGFVFVFRDRSGAPMISRMDEKLSILRYMTPVLALDLSEHAYFTDYLYDKRGYINAMLAQVDLSEIFSVNNSGIYLDTPV